jgi:uncharacterized tellurite resistance protein B-like protein
MELLSDRLRSSRFVADAELLESLKADERISPHLDGAVARVQQNRVRAQLLSHAVRVDLRLIPGVARSFQDLRERAAIAAPMEAYVYEESSINAFVAKGRTHVLIVLSSGAVNSLSDGELQFVVGHEIGHAIFGHVDVATPYLLEHGRLDARGCMQVLAWQRAAEISADRAGLVCCGSLDVAATALFKTLSGLTLEGSGIQPAEFAAQWDHLEREVVEGGESDHWQLSHPFPPLRMKAMMLFWELGSSEELPAETTTGVERRADREVRRLLAMMDPLARSSVGSPDPMLADFFLWGGLFIAVANGRVEEPEIERLASITSRAQLEHAIRGGIPESAACLERFDACISRRRQRLRALEIHRIIQGLLRVAAADGAVDPQETQALHTLANRLGIREEACDLLLSNVKGEA